MTRGHARSGLLVAALATVALLLVGAADGSAAGGRDTGRATYAENPDNPLAGGTWGVYTGSADGVYPAYQRSTGTQRSLLAKIALRPRVRWFGGWMTAADASAKLRDYIRTTQAGDPDVLVQLAVFRLWPQGEGAKDKPLTAAAQDAYRRWIDAAAQAIGGARVAMVLEPDLPVALGGWQPQVREQLTAYAAHVFGQLPRTSVYIDASDSDWLSVPRAADLLLHSGIAEVRGFALGATHYSSTESNVAYGRQLVAALAAAGVPGRHFVVDTADNGRPFTWLQYRAAHPHGDFDNAQACRTTTQQRCDTLGIPPTTEVATYLPADLRPGAQASVDAYLWFGRPWLYRQSSPFLRARALRVARTTPY
ncbi:endoglucanase [Marmoricola sp. URHA0025 HA25]